MTRSPAFLASLLLLTLPAAALAQHPERATTVTEGVEFIVYDADGNPSTLSELLAALDGVEAALVGETHTDSIGHEVEEEILIGAAARFGLVGERRPDSRPIVLSMEFFERDVQLALDEYLAGLITEDQFLSVGRPWDNYETAYRTMVRFARAHEIPVIAANAPRRYVNRVTRLGSGSLDELSEEARAFLPPLPYPGPSEAYEAQFFAEMMEGMAEAEKAEDEGAQGPVDRTGREAPANHGMGFALQSQALWDASMSHAIAGALDRDPAALVIHYVGGFHVAEYTGIPEKVLHYRPGTRLLTISIEPVEDITVWNDEDHAGLADFVILTQAPKTEEEGESR